MKRNWLYPLILAVLTLVFSYWILFFASALTVVLALQTTDTPAPQVSSTAMFITVITEEPKINVRMGPSSSIYPVVGSLLRGATAPALGRSPGGDWVQIEFPGAPYDKGWVYSPLVQVSPGTLLVIEPPPTPVQPPTSTIDPTLAAQYPTILPTTTHLPTFTPPAFITVRAYTETSIASSASSSNSVPLAIVIIALAILGVIGFFLSLILSR
jgi:Bacterial SH3 domain